MSLLLGMSTLARSPACNAVVGPACHRAFATTSTRSSHIGSLPIAYPAEVHIEEEPCHTLGGVTCRVCVEGPKGRLFVDLMPFVNLVRQRQESSNTPIRSTSLPRLQPTSSLSIRVADPAVKHQRAVWGLTRSLIANAVVGVSTGYTLSLRLVGVGYRAAMDDRPGASQRINLKLGYAHPVLIELPLDVVATTPTTTTIVLSGIDKQRLGEVAARIRRWRKPEPYNVRLLSSQPHEG